MRGRTANAGPFPADGRGNGDSVERTFGGRVTARMRIGGVITALFLAVPGVAGAAVDPFGADPLDLVAYAEQVRVYTSGVDTWEVWVCDTTNGGLALNPVAIVDVLNTQLDPYFAAMSDGRYRPTFRVGGTVSAGQTTWPDDPFDMQAECRFAVQSATSGTARGVLIAVDAAYEGGFATAGVWCEVPTDCPTTYPDNGRFVVVGGSTVTSVGGRPPALRTVAHELGHAMSFPHSFGGDVTFLGGLVYEYDNAMDVMSGGDRDSLDIGTIGLNRYAAGWMGADRVRFHRGGTLTHRLAPHGLGGPAEILILPTDGAAFEVLGARVRTSYDSGLPREGIEVYRIDQTSGACNQPTDGTCWGVERRTMPVPPPVEAWSDGHVFGVGESFSVRGVSVEVVAFDGSSFELRVSGAAVTERFVDDDGNFHEAAIEAIAGIGVSTGCNPTTDRYCPSRAVSRAEMAAFLLRAIGDTTSPATSGTFPDVPVNAWYAPAVERVAELGITTGYTDGTFRPAAAVSRAEMAVFLTRAFPGLADSIPAGVFADVAVDAWFAGAAEGLYGAGVTTGCSTAPLRFCPQAAVARDAMASFLARSLGLTG